MAKKKRNQKKAGKGNGFLGFIGGAALALLRILPVVILGAGFGWLCLGVRNALYADPNLAIQKIEVTPADSLLPEQRQMLENRWVGKNIMTVDLKKISENLKKDPAIQTARVTKYLPSKLGIEVERRQPIACIQLAPQGNCGLISQDGMILSVIPPKTAPGLVIEAFEAGARDPKMGGRLEVRGFREAVEFVTLLREQEFAKYEPLSRVSIDHIGNVGIHFADGPQIRLGRRPVDSLRSLEKVIPLLKREDRTKIEYVDLQFDNVIVKRKR